jgi:two-component system response regulator
MRSEVEIVLIEDNPADVELTLHALRRNKLANRIEVLGDGEEAIAYLFCEGAFASRAPAPPPKLVLLDLKLPKLDGLDVLRRIKADPRTRSIPVVVLTCSNEEADMVQSYQLGVNSYIRKPVEFSQFQETVKQVGLYWLVVNVPPPPEAFRAEA